MADDSQEDYTNLETIALAAGNQATGRLIIDRSLASIAQGGRVMVTVGGNKYSGALNQFDGERLVVSHEIGNSCSIIWVQSGVVLTAIADD